MGKCTCTIQAGNPVSLLLGCSNYPSRIEKEEALTVIDWPAECLECGKEVASPDDAAAVLNTEKFGKRPICLVCQEIVDCFFCSCSLRNLWPALRKEYNTIGLGNLTELISPEAKAVLIEKVDQWLLEDDEKEDPWRGVQG